MRIGLATVYTPPIRGGAEFLADGLADALSRAGHQVHRHVAPFSFASAEDAMRSMDLWASQDFTPFGGAAIDRVVCLKFPTYLLKHPSSVAWLLHQHRPVYELLDTPYGLPSSDPAVRALRERVIQADRVGLGRMRQVFTIAQRVSDRLLASVGVASAPIYHPPDGADLFRREDAEPYILVPSRLEALKRQDLLLRGFAQAGPRGYAVLVGEGGQRPALEKLAADLGVADRVRFLGGVSRRRLVGLYARAQAVYFGPFDEDYGYVTLEAMLSGKAVVTCTDSGGPLEFVVDGETGWIAPPTADGVAAAIRAVFDEPAQARERGRAGLDRYHDLRISWDGVVERLTAAGDGAAP